jgi:hypothetical protein
MKAHTKKLIAPIVIAIVIVLYLICYAIHVYSKRYTFAYKVLGGVIPFCWRGLHIFLIERIKEIRR